MTTLAIIIGFSAALALAIGLAHLQSELDSAKSKGPKVKQASPFGKGGRK